MGITYYNKEISRKTIKCNEKLNLKISLEAEPDSVCEPADILLAINNSCNLKEQLCFIRNSSKAVTDTVLRDCTQSCKSRIAVMEFSDEANIKAELTLNKSELKFAIDSITSSGNANHCLAFKAAYDYLSKSSANKRVLIMLTDGFSSSGCEAAIAANFAKEAGIDIYILAYSSQKGINIEEINDWVSVPVSEYLYIAPNDVQIDKIFSKYSSDSVKPGATDIVINEKISPCFKINSILTASKGKVIKVDENNLLWQIKNLGNTEKEKAELIFEIEHKGNCTGNVSVNKEIYYCDKENHKVVFPSPTVNIDCCPEPPAEPVIIPEICPEPIDIAVDGCEDSVVIDVGEIGLESLGRILQLNVTLKNVCPHKRVALAAVLNEVDGCGIEYKRGLKILEVPAHKKNKCVDVKVTCIKFILPESLDVSGNSDSICNKRNFKVKFIAHYIDNDLICCK